MSPRAERRVRMLLWGMAALLLVGSVALAARALAFPSPLGGAALDGVPSGGRKDAQDLGQDEIAAFARKKMSRTIVKPPPAPPPPPPKPQVPPLDTLVRLSGITAFRNGQPPEALIESRRENQTRSYKVGEAIGTSGAIVREIADVVLVEYDSRRWKLSFTGVEALPAAPVGAGGTP